MRKISKKQNDAPAHLFRQTVNEKKKVIGFLCALGIGVFLLQACNKADDPVPGTDSLTATYSALFQESATVKRTVMIDFTAENLFKEYHKQGNTSDTLNGTYTYCQERQQGILHYSNTKRYDFSCIGDSILVIGNNVFCNAHEHTGGHHNNHGHQHSSGTHH